VPLVGALWREMDAGGFSVILRETLPRFNGKLFKAPDVLPLSRDQIALLREASQADWTQVEPAIFGTLLERALDPTERHALGAHCTPRAAAIAELLLDASGKPVTRWDDKTMKKHPVIGKDVPDESAQREVERYVNPRPAEWPAADYVVGNPPFIGSKRMRATLGDGYVDALQEAWPDIPEASDLVMRWWHKAALLARTAKIKRFGLITSNSLRQAYVRRAVEPHLGAENPLSIVFAIPDHHMGGLSGWRLCTNRDDSRLAFRFPAGSGLGGNRTSLLNANRAFLFRWLTAFRTARQTRPPPAAC
jgi:hypothetical protein